MGHENQKQRWRFPLLFSTKLVLKVVRRIEMPKTAPLKVHLLFSKTRDDIEMEWAKYCEVTSKVPIFIYKT